MQRAVLMGAILIYVVGCGRGEADRLPVKGTVTYEGRPVDWGSIALRPARNSKGPAAGADIVDGKFEIPASAGPAQGPYTARITMVEPAATGSTAAPHPKGIGNMKSLEAPVEIEPDRQTYDFRLPLNE
jgi:hypothetical protein